MDQEAQRRVDGVVRAIGLGDVVGDLRPGGVGRVLSGQRRRVQAMMGVNVEAIQEDYRLRITGPHIPSAKALDQARVDDTYMRWSAKSAQQVAREQGTSFPVMRAELIAHRNTLQPGEVFPTDSGNTNPDGGDGETTSDGQARKQAGDGGDQR